MSDNLIFLLNKLSYQIVTESLKDEANFNPKKNEEKYIQNCVRKVSQKGCDVLLKKSMAPPLPDPCVTDYGGNWSPITLITDYGKELQDKRATKFSDILFSSVKCLQEKEYSCLNELLKFLLILKGPFPESLLNLQNNANSLCGSDFLSNSLDSITMLLDYPLPYSNDGLSRKSSFKRALQYKESWTKSFDSKFQILGEYSKKNLILPEKVSFDSIFSAKSTANKNQSQSNSFVFTDILIDKSSQSEKNLSDTSNNISWVESPLLDSFVDNPIKHKIPHFLTCQKALSKSSYLMKSSNQLKRTLHLLKEEDACTSVEINTTSCSSTNTYPLENVLLSRSSGIELKRNSNCSHSFAILYEKNCGSKSQESSFLNSDSILTTKGEKKKKCVPTSKLNSDIHSKEIILGLWEEEQSLIKEFKPELAKNLPTLRMISTTEFVEDVKYLLTGINSGTFQYNEEKQYFNMQYGTCLHDVMPESLYHFSKEFIETGNNYVKLSLWATECGKNNFDNCTTITQAFWKSIFEYLELYYSVVLSIPATTNIMVLKHTTRDISETMSTISDLCKVSNGCVIPEGGELLSYLLKVTEKLTKPCVKNVVFGILKNCCSIYFTWILQPWIFKGYLEKPNNEFFIEFSKQKMKLKSRGYYNSFYIVNDKVPSFLKGYEESIFNCGKSIHFLKLFNAEDKFCQLLEKADHPNISLCLSDDELQNLEIKFKDYRNRVIEICGQNISIKDLRSEEKEKEKAYCEFVKECRQKQEEQRQQKKLHELEELKAVKELQNQLLNEQMNLIRLEKEKKKKEEEMELKKIEEKIQQAAESEKENINKRKKIIRHYYDKMMKALDKQLCVAEITKKKFQKMLSKSEMTLDNDYYDAETLDIINENQNLENLINTKTQIEVDSNLNPITTGSSESLPESIVTLKEFLSNVPQRDCDLSLDENSNPHSNDSSKYYSVGINSKPSKTSIENTSKNIELPKNHYLIKNNNVRKSFSQRSTAAEEAIKNKVKILKSEFGISITQQPEAKVLRKEPASVTELEKNRLKVLESEYNILKCESDVILVKQVTSKMEIAKENEKFFDSSNSNLKYKTSSLDLDLQSTSSNFLDLSLQRKPECLDLNNSLEGKTSENSELKSLNSNSFGSFATLTNERLIEEENIVSNCESDAEEVIINSSGLIESNSTTALINPKYQDALQRDSEISYSKLSYVDIFHSVKELEMEKFPCTDFMNFERFLKKSLIIPLIIQEKLANDALLKHLLIGENLLSHLKSLRGFFFLYDGEFGRSFIHSTFQSLSKCTEPKQFFERSNLGNIVNEALNYTIHNAEPNSQNLSFQIVKMPPFLNHSSHDVLSPFELSYKIDWPLSIILTEKALSKYKLVFKFLLKLKRIIWTLNENFLYLNSYFKNKKLNRKFLMESTHYHKIQIYRHAMTQVIITLDEYIYSNGIELPWIAFLKDLETTENIDHLYQKHVRYIKDVATRCFLTKNSVDLLDCIHNVIELALRFHYTSKSTYMVLVMDKYEHPKFHVLKTTFNEFCSVIKTFIKKLKEKIASNQILKCHYTLIEKFDLKLT